ncbi:ligase-associated DNA damage response exonuclease [Subsaximicrobium wynnwilliamsii]|uniref:Ligase-associated DNA damage response exonuclease n=1 Tax=Subsaximicrobium wynnwilliamsii TaxID=291179 RepID=A0A5C6ZEP2_9FLAO|nr:ligase-associated DNA damage response exonuclease [Subsaximicrobium wynnwilliamsii]TXD81961.1 ligase-associated DNA damage response exonuclease [Subsaximicrobium wynnwilliamsii]TXD87659.1 ligase-associated DNA damage response exonuclease [Subsaximicrobium wynnwilliamsii]TXE01406.1 ligase-associated DNA damage response exonuclease [Subsaximicrobium wynnwilliamsii]
MKLIKFTKKGIYCIPGKFYLDPWFPVDFAIISHGHADHARWGMSHYLCHDDSKAILKHRIGQDISVESMPYNSEKTINGVKVGFFPAGHTIGSAQIRLEHKGFVVVFSGDYKVKNDYLTVPFEPVKCHEFITESTFGLPIYNWMKEEELQQKMQDWVLNNQARNRTSVFLGYSLGKAQRLMKLMEGMGEIYVHTAIHNINEAIATTGIKLPATKKWTAETDKKEVQNKIVIVPPALLGSNMIKRIPNAATAICSGWMQIRGNKRWQSVDAGFPVSDHADWNGLLQAVKATEAEKVYVTHGSQAIFSKYLNEIGIPSEEVKTEYGSNEDDTEAEPKSKQAS